MHGIAVLFSTIGIPFSLCVGYIYVESGLDSGKKVMKTLNEFRTPENINNYVVDVPF